MQSRKVEVSHMQETNEAIPMLSKGRLQSDMIPDLAVLMSKHRNLSSLDKRHPQHQAWAQICMSVILVAELRQMGDLARK